jgi:hypothetical protein
MVSDNILEIARLMKTIKQLTAIGVEDRTEPDGSHSLRVGKKLKLCGDLNPHEGDRYSKLINNVLQNITSQQSRKVQGLIDENGEQTHLFEPANE